MSIARHRYRIPTLSRLPLYVHVHCAFSSALLRHIYGISYDELFTTDNEKYVDLDFYLREWNAKLRAPDTVFLSQRPTKQHFHLAATKNERSGMFS